METHCQGKFEIAREFLDDRQDLMMLLAGKVQMQSCKDVKGKDAFVFTAISGDFFHRIPVGEEPLKYEFRFHTDDQKGSSVEAVLHSDDEDRWKAIQKRMEKEG